MPEHAEEHLSDELLQGYVDAGLHEADRIRTDEHLSGCSRCRARLAEFRRLFATIEACPELPLERDLAPAVMQAIHRSEPWRRAVRFGLPAAEAAVAAGLLLAAWRFIDVGLQALHSTFTGVFAGLTLLPGSVLLPPATAWLGWARGLRWDLLDPRNASLPVLWTPTVLATGAVGWIAGNWLLPRRQGAGNRHAD